MATIFVAGGTGYIGGQLLRELVRRGHAVRALARRGSEGKLPPGVRNGDGRRSGRVDLCRRGPGMWPAIRDPK
jgi:nucleoside-diphosphate-sugar epimerase